MPSDARIAFQARNTVGESLIWDHRDRRLYWVDIIQKRIHALDPEIGAHDTWKMPEIATSIGLRAAGGFVVGLAKTINAWVPGGDLEPLAIVEPDLADNRLNEGVVGPDGALWVGTMQNNIHPDGSPKDMTASTGALYRVTADGAVKRVSEAGFGITNTLIWTRDGRLITADTTRNVLYSFAIDPVAGDLRDRRTILEGFPRGLPDGSCPDTQGHFWNCRVVGGSCLIRVSSEGTVDRVVDLPCSWPTSCAFGGTDLETLFVTSARFTMGEDHLRACPEEGSIVALNVGVRGRPSNLFG